MAVHAIVIASAYAYEPPAEDRSARTQVAIELVAPAEPTPIDVFVAAAIAPPVDPPVDFSIDPPVDVIDPPTRSPAPRPRAAIQTTRAATAVVEPAVGIEPGTGSEPTTRSRYFDMRGGQPAKVDLRLRRDFRDPLDNPPAGTTPQVDVPETGKLRPSGRGTYKSDEGVFTAKVSPDGSVNLKDAKNLRFKIPDPRKLPKAVAKHVGDWAQNPNKIPSDQEAVAVNNHRSADKDTKPDHGSAPVPVLGGGFDITDALMRRKKIDPYAARKLAYLDSTRDERVQIGNRHRKAQLEQATQLLQKNIDRLFATVTDPAARRQGLFELWDDCAETGDAKTVDAGRIARTHALGVIRARFPATGPHAYTAQELVRLNQRRQSKAAFEPYR